MIRSFNYTGRMRIPRNQIYITLRNPADGERTFEFSADLQQLDLPSNAPVRVEAYHRQSLERFECGTVGRIEPPLRPDLSAITGDRVLFRVKVLAPPPGAGTILAVADQVRPVVEDVSEQESILPVEPMELGDQIWRLQFDEDEAVLQVNNRIPDVKMWVRTDPAFGALVFPSVLREILTNILMVQAYPEPEEGHWTGRWVRYAGTLLSEQLPPAEELDERAAWIDAVIENFAWKFRLRQMLIDNLESMES